MIPTRHKKTNISQEVTKGKKLQEKIKQLAEEAAKESIESFRPLSDVIAEISKREGFNRLQIQRLVEEGNTITYNKRYDKLRSSNDRRIEFPLASLDNVIQTMGSDAPPEIVNPNFANGGQGGGEMNKAATIEPSYIHTPHGRIDEKRTAMLEKTAAHEQKLSDKELAKQTKDMESTMFKIASSLVMTEKRYKNANEVFNTLLHDVSLSDHQIDGIQKRAHDIAKRMVQTKRAPSSFVITLKENPTEKIASHLLGEYSLLKEAESPKVKEVKVQPTVDIGDFQQMVALARKLQGQQLHSTGDGVKMNG